MINKNNIRKFSSDKMFQVIETIQKINQKSGLGYILAISFILWFVMFPEFSITADNCRVTDENGVVYEIDMTDRELALAVLEADSDEVVIKSRFLEMIKEWSEEAHDGESTD